MSTSSSSSTATTATTVNGVTRISGLSSGVDVDSLVEQLMTAESTKLNKMKQQQQLLEWKQEAYRSVIDEFTTFSDTYLNLTSSSSILKQSNFQQFSTTSDDTAVTASATGNATAGSHTVTVSQLATAATVSSADSITKTVTGASTISSYSALANTSFTMTVDGTSRTVSFGTYSGSDTDSTAGIAYIQAAVNSAIGTTTNSSGTTINKVTVALDSDGYLTFTPTTDSGVSTITVANSSTSGAFSAMGFTGSTNLTNRLTTSSTLSTVAGKLNSDYSTFISENADSTTNSTGEIEFKINGKTFSFDSSDSISDMISTVNADTTANVTMKYDSNTDKFVITADDTGAGNTITMSDVTGSFVSKLLTVSTAGTDAKVSIDGTSLTRSSNTITQDGVTYTLNKVSSDSANVSVTQDTDAIYDVINNFVTAYNTLLSDINSKLSEDYDSDYAPLTSDQEDEMSDTEISKWNEKAKTGLLENDLTLSTMLNKIRSAVMSSVSGVSESLTSIGITTSTYTEQGKLHVDEDTLKSAISSDPTSVMNLFTQASTTYSGTTTVRTLTNSERTVRTSQEGIAYKIYDILQDYVGTVRDSGGNKGILLEKYGIENDTSDTDNSTQDQLDTLADKIEAEEDRLSDVEDRYYDKFTAMETALEKLSSQYSIISSFSSSS